MSLRRVLKSGYSFDSCFEVGWKWKCAPLQARRQRVTGRAREVASKPVRLELWILTEKWIWLKKMKTNEQNKTENQLANLALFIILIFPLSALLCIKRCHFFKRLWWWNQNSPLCKRWRMVLATYLMNTRSIHIVLVTRFVIFCYLGSQMTCQPSRSRVCATRTQNTGCVMIHSCSWTLEIKQL